MEVLIPLPPWPGVGRKIESLIRRALYDFEMLSGVENIAVALSGGKDSLTLLFMLKAISGRGFPQLNIHAIHVNGEFSCGAGVNINYLKCVCEKLDINLIVCESTQKLETLECYSCSRERRKLIFDAARRVGADTIAFGHHRDDSAQTLLLNLFVKGEFEANLPKLRMHLYEVTILRPMIYVPEEMVRTFAQQQGFSRITCRCPVGQNSKRKKVDQLLTEIEEFFPHARKNIAQAGLLFGSKKAAKEDYLHKSIITPSKEPYHHEPEIAPFITK